MAKQMKITAKDLLELLAVKHSKDTFVPECKTGPTQGHACPRLDAWAMKPSWANPHTYGYEIKVSRSDFLGDNKWHQYLPYCSHFSFVTAPGVCTMDEIPSDCGWMVATSTGTRLYTKKKAPWRDISVPEDIYRYILMSRSQICREYRNDSARNADYWKHWLEKKRENQKIGVTASRRLRQLFHEEVTRVETEIYQMKKEVSKYQDVKEMLKRLGVESIHQWINEREIKDALNEIDSQVPDSIIGNIEDARDRLQRTLDEIAEVNGVPVSKVAP